MMKKLVVTGVLGTVLMLSAGLSAKAAVYRRPVVYRPYHPRVWVPPVRPYVYTYPTYPAPVAYGYPAPYATGVYMGAPGISLRLGR